MPSLYHLLIIDITIVGCRLLDFINIKKLFIFYIYIYLYIYSCIMVRHSKISRKYSKSNKKRSIRRNTKKRKCYKGGFCEYRNNIYGDTCNNPYLKCKNHICVTIPFWENRDGWEWRLAPNSILKRERVPIGS